MGMEMSSAMGNGVVHPHVPLEPLVQIASLSNVDRNPSAILSLAVLSSSPCTDQTTKGRFWQGRKLRFWHP
jgi:hypothetical protein